MTTYPKPSDPVSALTRADGTTSAHSADHGKLIDTWENVKHFGAKGDGATDDTAAINAAILAVSNSDVGAGVVYFPPGEYFLADGSSLVPKSNVVCQGSGGFGVPASVITAKNAYIFRTGNVNGYIAWNFHIRDLWLKLRTGSVTGGAVRAVYEFGAVQVSGWHMDRVEMQGVQTNTSPLMYFDGAIGCHWDRVSISTNAGHGLHLQSAVFASNINTFTNGRIAGTGYNAGVYTSTYAAVKDESTSNFQIRNTIIESNSGFGYWGVSTVSPILDSIWFDDANDHVRVQSTSGLIINDTKFHYNTSSGNGGNASAVHVNLILSPRAGIYGGTFQDNANDSANGLTIADTTCWGTTAIGTKNLLYSDAGTNTFIYTSDDGKQYYGGGAYYEMKERSGDVAAPGSDKVVVYARDTGGSTQLVARFSSGAIQPLATQAVSAIQTYTVTHPTTDRALDVTADTLPQVAEVLGTLIADLQTRGIIA